MQSQMLIQHVIHLVPQPTRNLNLYIYTYTHTCIHTVLLQHQRGCMSYLTLYSVPSTSENDIRATGITTANKRQFTIAAENKDFGEEERSGAGLGIPTFISSMVTAHYLPLSGERQFKAQ